MKVKDIVCMIKMRIANDFDMRQSKYADHLGVSSAYVSAVLKGKRVPSQQMCNDVGVSVEKQVIYKKM